MIDLSRENAEAAGYLDALSGPAISIITAQELIVGARDKRDLYAIDSLVSTYRVIRIDAALRQRAYGVAQAIRVIRRLAHIRLSDRSYRDRTELHTGQQEPEALRNDRRLAV